MRSPVDEVLAKDQLKYIYLDMVTYNDAAARFYEKQDFVRVATKRNHYTIEGAHYDAYVYVWHSSAEERERAKSALGVPRVSLLTRVLHLPMALLALLRIRRSSE